MFLPSQLYDFQYFTALICFVRNTVAREAIINGEIAAAHQFPYQVSLHHGHRYICGGGIIADQFVLTAAHCVFDNEAEFKPGPLYVLAGTNDLSKTDEPAEKREVKKIFVPKLYRPGELNAYGDLAVLMLNDPLGLANKPTTLKALKLPSNKHARFMHETVEIAGFGWNWIDVGNDTFVGGLNDTLLRFAAAEVFLERHNSFFKTIFGGAAAQEHISAKIFQHNKSRPRGVCFGDSGGPLVHDGTVIGIAQAAAEFCSEERFGGRYARVARYLDFIEHATHDWHHNETLQREL